MTAAADQDFSAACATLAADPTHADVLQVRMATCPNCKGWVMQAAWPRCQNDKETQQEFADCAKAGMDISTISLTEAREVKYCEHYGKHA